MKRTAQTIAATAATLALGFGLVASASAASDYARGNSWTSNGFTWAGVAFR